MSKLQELDLRIEEINKQKEKHNVAIESVRKDKQKLHKELEKKIRKLFGRVKVDLILNETKFSVEINNEQVFLFDYNTFTFKNIDKTLAVELQNLYLEYYGEPLEYGKNYFTHYLSEIKMPRWYY